MKSIWVFLLFGWLVVGAATQGSAQLNRPPSILFGGSLGVGGMYDFFKFSADVHFRRGGGSMQRFYGLNGVFTSVRVAPGLHYLSFGVTQRVAAFRPRVHKRERPIIVSAYYARDYFLSSIKHPDRDRQMIMLMTGIRFNMDRLQRVFCEAQVGAMMVLQSDVNPRFLPMGEFRLSGVIQRHVKKKQKPVKK